MLELIFGRSTLQARVRLYRRDNCLSLSTNPTLSLSVESATVHLLPDCNVIQPQHNFAKAVAHTPAAVAVAVRGLTGLAIGQVPKIAVRTSEAIAVLHRHAPNTQTERDRAMLLRREILLAGVERQVDFVQPDMLYIPHVPNSS